MSGQNETLWRRYHINLVADIYRAQVRGSVEPLAFSHISFLSFGCSSPSYWTDLAYHVGKTALGMPSNRHTTADQEEGGWNVKAVVNIEGSVGLLFSRMRIVSFWGRMRMKQVPGRTQKQLFRTLDRSLQLWRWLLAVSRSSSGNHTPPHSISYARNGAFDRIEQWWLVTGVLLCSSKLTQWSRNGFD